MSNEFEDSLEPERKETYGTPSPQFEVAGLYAAKLLEHVGEDAREYVPREYAPQNPGLFTADIEASIDRFSVQLALCRREGLGFPCFLDPESDPVPMDWSENIDLVGESCVRSFSDRRLASYKGLSPADFLPRGQPYALYEPSKVVEFLRRGLTTFLTARFRGGGGPNLYMSSGLKFTVITKRDGLRVHYSPSYFLSWGNVFGSPTSPVFGWIQPGRYKFGAIGRGFPFRFDSADFDVPPQTQAHLVNI